MSLLDLFFPRFCLGCGFLGCYICPRCKKNLSYFEREVCLYCGRASLLGMTHPGCFRKNGVDGMTAIFHYNDFLKKIIKDIKYRLAKDVWEEFRLTISPEALLKLGLYRRLDNNLLVQPIPLHENKYKVRGFNQAKMISDYFQLFLKLKQINILVRRKETFAQAQCKKNKDRLNNIRGAFVVKERISGGSIILVDDVVTSGATVKEAAKVLKKSGAEKVFVLALAKG